MTRYYDESGTDRTAEYDALIAAEQKSRRLYMLALAREVNGYDVDSGIVEDFRSELTARAEARHSCLFDALYAFIAETGLQYHSWSYAGGGEEIAESMGYV